MIQMSGSSNCVSGGKLVHITKIPWQEEQRRKAALPLHFGRTYALWSDRMSQAACLAQICRQAPGLPRDYATLG